MFKNILFSLLIIVCIGKSPVLCQPVNLKCEYQINPINIDDPNPRFSWNFESAERNWTQSAYLILVAGSSEKLDKNIGDLWDSKKITADENIHIKYKGKTLRSYSNCWWKVKVWDKNNKESEWSQPSYFKMGVLKISDWQGKWIASDLELMEYQKKLRAMPDFGMEPETEIWGISKKLREMTKSIDHAPAVYMRKEFKIQKTILRATASVSGLGLHELYLNGKRVSDQYLNPAPSDYQKRVFYNTYDVTQNLKNGDNAIGIILGNGWFNLIIPHVLRYYAADYISPPQLLMEIQIEYSDGTTQKIFSDPTWKFTTDGPITFNCFLGGETYDARKEMTGWNISGYNDKNWKNCKTVNAPEGKLYSQQLAPVKKIEIFKSKKVEKLDSIYKFDLGIEIVGWAKLKVKGKPGQKIEISYPGSQSHTLGRYQTCYYILKGDGEEEYEPRFSINGFRYVNVKGIESPEKDAIEGIQVCTAMEQTGDFSCSNEKLTKLQSILLHTIRNYIVHIPNDPTREKVGWTQDVENGFDVNAYNFDCATMYSKWQDDFLDIQHKDGYVPPVAPSRFDGPTINGPWWGGMIVYTPWKMYQYFGDKQILERSYSAMKKQVNYLKSISENYIVKWGLGDWLEPGTVRPKITPVPLTSTIGYYLFTNIIKQTAEILGKKDEAIEYEELANKIKEKYNEEFLKDGRYALGSQASQIMSLYFGLVPDGRRDLVIKRLLEQIKIDSNHINTGFVSTPVLLMAISELGYLNLAYTMATQNTYPSWFDMVFNKGNTVFKESWDGGLVQMPSFGGPLGAWFFHTIGGIRPDMSAPGFKKIIINPNIIGDLTWNKTSYNSLYGKIISNWELTSNNACKMTVRIPCNTSAEIYLPSRDIGNIFENGKPIKTVKQLKFLRTDNEKMVFEAGSGIYDFEVMAFEKNKK
jgi:alpha-L-rhamnosidase